VNLDWMALTITAGFLVALTAAAGSVSSILGTEQGAARRLRRRLAPSPDLPELARQDERVAQLVARGLSPLARIAAPMGEAGTSELASKLLRAGYRAPSAVQIFLALKVILAGACAGVTLLVDALGPEPLPSAPAWAVGLATIGMFLPNVWLDRRVAERQRAIEQGLPDVLDLLVTCVEAGLGLDIAIQRVAREIALARPELAEELTLAFLEVKAGARRSDALRHLAERTGVQDVKTLVATLNQTELFGTSVATALRVQSEGVRTRRMQSAESRAATLSVKMTFPLVICFLPAFVVVVLGPAIVNIAQVLRSLR
jgi:tight adherence protein C